MRATQESIATCSVLAGLMQLVLVTSATAALKVGGASFVSRRAAPACSTWTAPGGARVTAPPRRVTVLPGGQAAGVRNLLVQDSLSAVEMANVLPWVTNPTVRVTRAGWGGPARRNAYTGVHARLQTGIMCATAINATAVFLASWSAPVEETAPTELVTVDLKAGGETSATLKAVLAGALTVASMAPACQLWANATAGRAGEGGAVRFLSALGAATAVGVAFVMGAAMTRQCAFRVILVTWALDVNSGASTALWKRLTSEMCADVMPAMLVLTAARSAMRTGLVCVESARVIQAGEEKSAKQWAAQAKGPTVRGTGCACMSCKNATVFTVGKVPDALFPTAQELLTAVLKESATATSTRQYASIALMVRWGQHASSPASAAQNTRQQAQFVSVSRAIVV